MIPQVRRLTYREVFWIIYAPLGCLGKPMGDKNHAIVLMGCRRIEEALDRDADIQWQAPAGNRIVKAKAILTQLEESISR